MVKRVVMLISEFARTSGLSVDTVRFYVRKGLLRPETTAKGGARPYQIFKAEHVEAAHIIRTAQSLGFSIKEIVALNEEYRAAGVSTKRSVAIMQSQIGRLQEKADQLAQLISYMRAKITWLEKGSRGPEPRSDGTIPSIRRQKGR